MLRHLKRRQQELENTNKTTDGGSCGVASLSAHSDVMPLAATNNQALDMKRRQPNQEETKQQKRVRGRRSSKPAMEKRRRARINECLDILKSYVLNDSTNLNRLGIDLNGSENQVDEESIARQILKSSGLINRHRGRKNPNKLEKADILELTVDYVRRLHEQRDELLSTGNGLSAHQKQAAAFNSQTVAHQHHQRSMMGDSGLSYGQQVVPAHLNEPLTLDLSPKSRQNGQMNTSSTPPMLAAYHPPPNTPLTPPSSASSLQGSDVTESSFQHHHHHHQNQLTQMQLLSQVLEGRYKIYPEWVSVSQFNDQ